MIYIFGYGSLINKTSRDSTCKCKYESIPVILDKEFNYRRIWKYRSYKGNFTALTLEKVSNNKATNINGVLFRVSNDNIKCFDIREKGYKRIVIPNEYIKSYHNYKLELKDSIIYTYVAINNNCRLPNKDYQINQTYLDICINGCLFYGEQFTRDFLLLTQYWSKYWINNRTHQNNEINNEIDDLLRSIGKIKLNYRINL